MNVISDHPATAPADAGTDEPGSPPSAGPSRRRPANTDTAELAEFVVEHAGNVDVLAEHAPAGWRRRYEKLLRTRRAVGALLANGTHLDVPDDAARIRLALKYPGRCSSLSTIDTQVEWWSQQACRCHRWRGHTASVPAAPAE